MSLVCPSHYPLPVQHNLLIVLGGGREMKSKCVDPNEKMTITPHMFNSFMGHVTAFGVWGPTCLQYWEVLHYPWPTDALCVFVWCVFVSVCERARSLKSIRNPGARWYQGEYACPMRKSITGVFLIRKSKNMAQDRLRIRRTWANEDNPVISLDVKCQCGSILGDQNELNMN